MGRWRTFLAALLLLPVRIAYVQVNCGNSLDNEELVESFNSNFPVACTFFSMFGLPPRMHQT